MSPQYILCVHGHLTTQMAGKRVSGMCGLIPAAAATEIVIAGAVFRHFVDR